MQPALICWVLLLTVAPLTAAAAIFFLEPSRWGSENPLSIIVMAVFGLMSVPLWLTYIPALVLTPKVMKRLSMSPRFLRVSPWVLTAVSLACGAIAGMLVLLPLIVLSLGTPGLATHWMIAGGVSGAITVTAIVYVYRKAERQLGQPV